MLLGSSLAFFLDRQSGHRPAGGWPTAGRGTSHLRVQPARIGRHRQRAAEECRPSGHRGGGGRLLQRAAAQGPSSTGLRPRAVQPGADRLESRGVQGSVGEGQVGPGPGRPAGNQRGLLGGQQRLRGVLGVQVHLLRHLRTCAFQVPALDAEAAAGERLPGRE